MIHTSELAQHVEKVVTIRGRLHTLRKVGSGLAFLILRDKDGLMQVVLEKPEEIEKLEGCLMGSVVSATGKAIEAPKTKFGYEIQNADIVVYNKVTYPSPIDISKDTIAAEPETIHDNKVVALRHPKQMQIFSIAATFEQQCRAFFDAHGFTQINSPKIIGFPTEGGAEVFSLEYFGKTAYLAQSPQFYKQMMVPVFERVYEIGRAYRAEKSNTSRHMSEILMLDVEMGFIDDFDDVLNMGEQFFQYVVEQTRAKQEKAFMALGAEKPLLPPTFPRYTIKQIQQLYKEKTGEDTSQELDMLPAQEVFICEYAREHDNSDVVYVTGFPREDAKFYHHQNIADPTIADRADLLFRGVEIATLTRREVKYDALIDQIKSRGFDPENPGLKHYLDSFKYGMPEEGGRGRGIARSVQKLIGLHNAKDAELFPRDTQRVTP